MLNFSSLSLIQEQKLHRVIIFIWVWAKKNIEKEMAGSLMKVFVVMMLMILLVVIQVECLSEPWCEIKCDALCLGNRLRDDFENCVKNCQATKC